MYCGQNFDLFKQKKVLLKAQHLEYVKIRPENERKIKILKDMFTNICNMSTSNSSEFKLQKSKLVNSSIFLFKMSFKLINT